MNTKAASILGLAASMGVTLDDVLGSMPRGSRGNKYLPRETEFVVIYQGKVLGEVNPITFKTRHEAHKFGRVFRPHTVKPINSLAAQKGR